MVHVLVAVKAADSAKSRLRDIEALRRRDLVSAMLADVLSALVEARTVSAVSIVTAGAEYDCLASQFEANVIRETEPAGLNRAFARAAASVRGPIAALAADIPCVSSVEIDSALAAASRMQRAFVPDHLGTGTVLLYSSGADLRPLFGADSARRHRDSGATLITGPWPGLRFDIDTVENLHAAYTLGPGVETARWFAAAAENGDRLR